MKNNIKAQNKNKYSSLLSLIVPSVISHHYSDNNDITVDNIVKFYNSSLYQNLENEETKLWHFSTSTLSNMYNDEIQYGTFDFPEVVS